MIHSILILWTILLFAVQSCHSGREPNGGQPDRPVCGIDLSHHNTVTDWDSLKLGFVFLKATEGDSYVDPEWPARWIST